MPLATANRAALALLFFFAFTVAKADTWDGLFIGINAGVVTSAAKYQTGPNDASWFHAQHQTAGMWANGDKTQKSSDPVGGLSIAYNRQTGAFVYGAEAELSFMDVNLQKTGAYPYTSLSQQYNYSQNTNAKGLFTLKGRAGYAFGNSLLSATAGVAATDLRTGLDYGDSYTGSSKYIANHEDRKLRLGWEAGIAYQYRLPSDLILKAEYQYIDFGKSSFSTPIHSVGGDYITQMNFSSKVYLSTFMLGIEKKF